MTEKTKPETGPQFTEGWPERMECVVIGGCADGTYIREMRSDADVVRLARPKHIKPIAHSRQSMPEIEKESDLYDIHVFDMPDSADRDAPIKLRSIKGVAVVQGRSLAWAWKLLVISYLQEHLRALQKRGGPHTIQH